ncbi:MAG: NAD-dependent epimerase/dehydratase family protein [Verrucomicrobiota bacterium]
MNTEGTRSLLRAAQAGGVRRFIFFSSIKAMSCGVGTSGQDPLDESATVVPDTPYGQSKLAAEKLVLDGGYVPEPVVLRLCMVYGPSGKGNLTAMIEAVRRNSFPPLPEVGNRRSMVHVDDVVEAALLAAEHPNAVKETFIVSDGCVYSTRQMYTLICRALDKPVPRWTTPLCILRAGATFGDLIGRLRGRRFVFDSIALQQLIGSAWFSSAKIQARLHYAPRWNLATALPAMVGA